MKPNLLKLAILALHSAVCIFEALPGVLGNREIRPLVSGEQGNKSLKLKGTGEQRQFWGTGNIENQDFDFGEQGKMLIFFRGTREQVQKNIHIIKHH